jgi:hypothetical protein
MDMMKVVMMVDQKVSWTAVMTANLRVLKMVDLWV